MLLKQIQYFMAVADCRHFTKAAEQLFVSQSALSQQITKLESDLGVKLINRVSHPIALTTAGQDFARYAANVLDALDTLEKKMQAYQPLDNSTLRIGMITGLGRIPLAEILSNFNTVHNEIKLSLVNHLSKELCKLLNEDVLDLAIFAAPYDIDQYNFDILTLEHEPFVAILPENHPLANQDSFSLAEAANEKFIFPTAENVSYDLFTESCKECGFTPQIASTCNHSHRRIDLVRAGVGLSLISESSLSSYPHRDGIRILPLTAPIYKHIVIARQKKNVYASALESFWQYVQKYAEPGNAL